MDNNIKMARKLDGVKFLTIMIVFIVGMIFMIAQKISSWWVWLVYITIWTITEMRVVRNIHFKWWVCILIIFILSVIDLSVVLFFS